MFMDASSHFFLAQMNLQQKCKEVAATVSPSTFEVVKISQEAVDKVRVQCYLKKLINRQLPDILFKNMLH